MDTFTFLEHFGKIESHLRSMLPKANNNKDGFYGLLKQLEESSAISTELSQDLSELWRARNVAVTAPHRAPISERIAKKLQSVEQKLMEKS